MQTEMKVNSKYYIPFSSALVKNGSFSATYFYAIVKHIFSEWRVGLKMGICYIRIRFATVCR